MADATSVSETNAKEEVAAELVPEVNISSILYHFLLKYFLSLLRVFVRMLRSRKMARRSQTAGSGTARNCMKTSMSHWTKRFLDCGTRDREISRKEREKDYQKTRRKR